jgi:hypothetical protein
MKVTKNQLYFLVSILFCSTMAMAQHTVITTPPEVSPMKMAPEMTEIWEPEVQVITPAKKEGDAPSDAIILFDGKNMNQWVSQKDTNKAASWKIVNNDYMEVMPDAVGIQTRMQFGDCQLHMEWSAPDEVVDG